MLLLGGATHLLPPCNDCMLVCHSACPCRLSSTTDHQLHGQPLLTRPQAGSMRCVQFTCSQLGGSQHWCHAVDVLAAACVAAHPHLTFLTPPQRWFRSAVC